MPEPAEETLIQHYNCPSVIANEGSRSVADRFDVSLIDLAIVLGKAMNHVTTATAVHNVSQSAQLCSTMA